MKRTGFTLIELLIVIGLLAALAAILLPSMMGDRTSALENICNYNQAGTMRTLRQYETLTSGMLPNGMHSGLIADGSSAMTGLPPALLANMNMGTNASLDANDVEALRSVGITKLAYGNGDPDATVADDKIGYKTLASASCTVASVTNQWKTDGNVEYSFNGKTVSHLMKEGYTLIFPLFIAPTTDWASHSGNSWVKGFEVGMDVPGACPVPDSEFAYYVAYIGLRSDGMASYSVTTSGSSAAPVPDFATSDSINNMQSAISDAMTGDWTLDSSGWQDSSDGTSSVCTATNSNDSSTATYTITYDPTPKAKLLGTSCPECGITNP